MISIKIKIVCFVFISIVAIPFTFCIYFFVKQQVLHYSMAEALEQKTLHSVTTTTANARWVSFGKEILIDGHLFDVESYKRTGNNLQLTGLYDTEEDNLNEQLNKVEQQKTRENPGEKTLLVSLLFQTFFIEKNPLLHNNFSSSTRHQHESFFSENLCSTCISVVSPPPKF